jgi:hypothetical protein
MSLDSYLDELDLELELSAKTITTSVTTVQQVQKVLSEPIKSKVEIYYRDFERVGSEHLPMSTETARLSLFEKTALSVAGVLSGLKFTEEEMIKTLRVEGAIKRIHCNFGNICDPEYEKVLKKSSKKSNRGRKRVDKPKKERRVQGTGEAFHSQLTFHMLKEVSDKPLKIKVFRTGVIQIPAGKIDLELVIEALNSLCDYLNKYFAVSEPVRIRDLYSSMKNYKFNIKLEPGERLNMDAFAEHLERDSLTRQPNSDTANALDTKYDREDNCSKILIKFSTPIPSKLTKTTTAKIFITKGGVSRVHLLGGSSAEASEKIRDHIGSIMETYAADVIITPTPIPTLSELYDTPYILTFDSESALKVDLYLQELLRVYKTSPTSMPELKCHN